MLFNKYDKMEHLKTERSEWTLRVRAQAVWKGINRQTNEFRGLNVIFIDESDCRIHAFVSGKISDLFHDNLKEGLIYTVSNFHVRLYTGDEKSRAVRNLKHIYFANHTILKCEEDNVTNIAPYAFDLWKLNEAEKFLSDSHFLIDVVGLLQERNVECVHPKDEPTKMYLRFQLCDGRNVLNVTFFEKLAEDFEKAVKEIKDDTVVVVIAFAKVNQYEGVTCLNNYPATRFYLNIDHYCVNQFKNQLSDSNFQTETVEIKQDYIAPMMTVSDIKKLGNENIQKTVRCQLTIKKVDQETNWYDNVCTSCGEEVNKVENRYKCLECNRNIPYPDKRFRLATICNDKTGVLAIILPDDEIQRIIGKNAFDLEYEDDDVMNGKNFPAALLSFERKEYVITLKISEKNVNKSSNIYHATELNDPVEMLGSHSPEKEEAPVTNTNIVTVDLEAIAHSSHSPPTGKSSNKVRGRDKVNKVPYEMEEHVPIAKLKIPKIEKA